MVKVADGSQMAGWPSPPVRSAHIALTKPRGDLKVAATLRSE